MNAYYVPNPELGAEDIAMNKIDETPVLSQNVGFQKMQKRLQSVSPALPFYDSMTKPFLCPALTCRRIG